MNGTHAKALYHEVDTRQNIYELNPKSIPDIDNIKINALAVACLMTNCELIENGHNYCLSSQVLTLSERVKYSRIDRDKPERFNAPLAPTEKFRDEPAPGFGSAFLVGEQTILTAGHCICDSKTSKLLPKSVLDNIRIVFGYHKTRSDKDKRTFQKECVYKIKKILSYNYNEKYNKEVGDWALIKLDRKVVNIKPMELDYSVSLNCDVYALGCPTGTAVKCAGLDYATVKSFTHLHVRSDLDLLGGNSGCPVINRTTHKVIAILIRGFTDYVIDESHKKLTGKTQVVNFRITQNMIAQGEVGYSLSQRLFSQMFCLYKVYKTVEHHYVDHHRWSIPQEFSKLNQVRKGCKSIEIEGSFIESAHSFTEFDPVIPKHIEEVKVDYWRYFRFQWENKFPPKLPDGLTFCHLTSLRVLIFTRSQIRYNPTFPNTVESLSFESCQFHKREFQRKWSNLNDDFTRTLRMPTEEFVLAVPEGLKSLKVIKCKQSMLKDEFSRFNFHRLPLLGGFNQYSISLHFKNINNYFFNKFPNSLEKFEIDTSDITYKTIYALPTSLKVLIFSKCTNLNNNQLISERFEQCQITKDSVPIG